MTPPPALDFTSVTETPGDGISRKAASMLFSRYRFATTQGVRRILEIGCGSGQGLGFSGRTAVRGFAVPESGRDAWIAPVNPFQRRPSRADSRKITPP